MTGHPPVGVPRLEWAIFQAIVENDLHKARSVIAEGLDPASPYCVDIADGARYRSPVEHAQLRGSDDLLAVMAASSLL